MRVLVSAVALAMLASACGTARSYRLPLDSMKAHDTFAPIAAVAGEMGLQNIEHPDSVNVQYDEATLIQFMVQAPQYNMVIIVDDKAVPPSELEQRFTDAKAKGDEIWEKALATMNKTSGDVSVSVNVNVNTAPAELTGNCKKLFDCYAQLATDLCASGDSGCQASFELKIEGNDEAGCREALTAVPAVAQPLSMAKPDYTIPAICE